MSLDFFLAHGDADALMHCLQLAHRAEPLQQDRLRQGCSLPENFDALPEL